MSHTCLAGMGSTEIRQLLTDRIYILAKHTWSAAPELLEAFSKEPSVKLLDRIAAFHEAPWYSEYRAALERIETGRYGRCSICGTRIPLERLFETPTERYCGSCTLKLKCRNADGSTINAVNREIPWMRYMSNSRPELRH